MPIAAVPSYLGQDFKGASPGLRFGLFLPIWTNRQDQESEVKKRASAKSKQGQELAKLLEEQGMEAAISYLRKQQFNPLPGLWDKNDFAARQAWTAIQALNPVEKRAMKALADRQSALAGLVPDSARLSLPALATAPFTTGLGNEHPLENGFAFLNPYGLPYLPGSGIKGVLRQAARELAVGDWGETHGWDEGKFSKTRRDEATWIYPRIDVLFGRESAAGETDHLRGALSFWDVIPQIKGDSLMVEIMTPHQSHYYQQKLDPKAGNSISPHDSGQPIPISYLTVPPGSGFTFHIVCDLAHLERLAPDLARGGRWKTLLTAAFEHAFSWCGFGAKTAVGYGAMQEDPAIAAERARRLAAERAERERQAEADRLASLSPEDRAWEEHQPVIAEFQKVFDEAKSKPYQPGSAFDQERLNFMGKALAWTDARSRDVAAELLGATLTKAWGTPGKKETRQRLKDAIVQLSGSPNTGDG